MAKKKENKQGSRSRKPKRIVSGITEFIDDNWWEDSRRSSRDKKPKGKGKSAEQKSSSKAVEKEKATKKEKDKPQKDKSKQKKAAPAKAKPSVKETPAVVEAETKSKRKRSRRRGKKSETAATAEAVQEPVVEKPAKSSSKAPAVEPSAPKKSKRRRRRSAEAASPGTPPEKTPDAEPVEEERPKKKRRRRKAKVETPVEKVPAEVLPEAPPAPESKRKRRKTAVKTDEAPAKKETSAKQKAPAKKETPAKKKAASGKKAPVKKRTRSNKASGFGFMDLSDEMYEALEMARYSEPTPIQAGLIPEALKGIDLMGQAQTGTGKTAAFAIPLLEMIDYEEHRGPQALVLVPTRELAVQVRDECAKLAVTGEVQVVAVYGGKPIRRQIEKLQRAPEIVVGTPGRVIDLNARGALFFGDLRQVVLDEADRMLDIGFRPDIEKILRRCPQSRQTLLLSATLPGPVLRLAQRYMRDPKSLDFSPKNIAVETIDQHYFTVDPERKFDLLLKLIEREDPAQAIIFCRTRRGTEKIYRRLSRQVSESVACIHGDLPQSTRDATMRKFRAGKLCILVATDVVGRGIDVSGVSHIINYDIPEFCDDYVHRVGRTGRMGREGVAYTLVTPEEGPQLTRIEMRINMLLQRSEMPGFDMGLKEVGEEDAPPPESKPVFGKPKRRFRRAL